MLKEIGESIGEKVSGVTEKVTETVTEGVVDNLNPMANLDMEGVKKDAIPLILCAVLVFFVIKG